MVVLLKKDMVDNPFSDTTTEKDEVKRDAAGNVIEAEEKTRAESH